MVEDQNPINTLGNKSVVMRKIIDLFPLLLVGALVYFTYYLVLLHGSLQYLFLKKDSLVTSWELKESLSAIARQVGLTAFCAGVVSLLLSIITYFYYRKWRGWVCLALGVAGFLAIL